jgi:hypothetical protein
MDLAEIVSPCTLAEFLTNYFGVKVLHAIGTSQRFASFFGTTPIELTETDPLIQTLERRLERDLEAPTGAHLHASHRGSPLQRLEQDVFLLQIAGRTRWTVHGMDEHAAEVPTWEGWVKEGDTLYIPGESWHASEQADTTPDSRALHLEIIVANPTGADLIEWMVRHLKRQKHFRTAVPRFAAPGTQADYLMTLRKVTAQMWRTPRLLEGFARHRNTHAVPRPVTGVPWSPELSGEYLIALAAPRRLNILRADKDTIYFVLNGQPYQFPEDAAPLLQFLCDHAPVSIGHFREGLAAEFDREEISDFLSALADTGIISIHAPGSAC